MSLLGLLLLVLLVSGFFISFDRIPYQAWVGYKGEALRNNLLAAERFLTRAGLRVQSFASLQELPPTTTTLLLATERLSLSHARTQALREWAQAGGHLLVVIWTIKGEGGEDALLDPLGIEQEYRSLEREQQWEQVYEIEKYVANVTAFGEPLKVHFDPRYRFKSAPANAQLKIADDVGLHVLALPLGRGRITAMTDAEFMTNENIGLNDHAAFTWHLLDTAGRDGEVWVVRGEDMPALGSLIWHHARAVVIAAALLLAVFLWSRTGRFGPLAAVPGLARKRLGEHVIASGWYLWRQGKAESLLADTREAIARRMQGAMHEPGGDNDSGQDNGVQLARAARMPVKAVHAALDPRAAHSESEFIDAVRTLETIRKSL